MNMTFEDAIERLTLSHVGSKGEAILTRSDGQTFKVPVDWLPEGVTEGDVLLLRCKQGKVDIYLHLFVTPKAKEGKVEEDDG